MSAARGIADLASATAAPDGTLYRAVEETGHFIHVAGALPVAPREDGGADPDLAVELIRGQSPSRPPAPYGVFDMRVSSQAPAAGALAVARALDPAAFVTPAIFEEGYLRLQMIAGRSTVSDALLDELERPAWVASNGLDSARMVRRLTPDAAIVLRDALLDDALTLSAVAEMTLRGLAERAGVTISFAPRLLLDALAAIADGQSRIPVDAIVALWMREDAVPLLQATGIADVERSRLARILADWTVAAFATPVAAADERLVPTVRLQPPPSMDDAMTWDLTRWRTTKRIVVLRLDPFEAVRQLVAAGGLERFWSETIVPPIDTGVVHIDLDTNLPHPIRGLAKAGVQLRAAPHPPERVHELSDALLFEEHQQPQRIVWRMSPTEPLRYEYTCFALLREGTTTRRVNGAVTASDTRRLLIGVNDLPVDLVSIGAGERLLSEAAVRGVCLRDTDATAAAADRVEFELSAAQPRLAVALAEGSAEQFSVHIEACPLDGGSCVALNPLPARGLKLDLSSFPQFGPQVVDVTVDFDTDAPLVALDLVPERDADDPAQAAVLSFTPSTAAGQWRYLNPTPFHSGYRYRLHASGDGAWSEVRPAGAPLHVRASEFTTTGNEDSAPNGNPDGLRFEDLYCYPGDEPDTHLVVPLVPGPEVDGADRPMLMTIPLGERGMLQLGVHLGPDGESLERLRVELARRSGVDPTVPRLQVAPIEVDGATLLITNTSGATHELARHDTSNFPPYTAIFSEQLEPEELEAVTAASAGKPGRLSARFDARVQQPVTVSALLRGDIAAIVTSTAAAPPADRERVAGSAIEFALETGALSLDIDASDASDTPELLERARTHALAELLALVLRLSETGDVGPPSQAPTELRVAFTEPSWRALTPTIDIASWFAARSPLQPTAP